MAKENFKRILHSDYLILMGLLVLAAFFRFYKLRTSPDWFQDEGEFIRLADYLSKGNPNFLGIRNSLLLIGRPPLFLWALAGLFKLFGTDILVLRSLAVTCSIITISICYILIHQAVGKKSAFYVAFLLAIFPEYIFYNRIGFSYNWTSLWMLIFVLGLWKYLSLNSRNWLLLACLSAGITFASDYIGIICILVLFLALLFTHSRHLWSMFIVGIPWLASMLPTFIISPADTWHDLAYTFLFGSGGGRTFIYQLAVMIVKYSELFRRQPLIVLGILGIFILNNSKLRIVLLSTLAGVFVILLPNRVLLAQYLLPIWPLVMIGLGYFAEKSVYFIYTFFQSSFMNLKYINRFISNEALRNILGSVGSTGLTFAIVFLPISYFVILSIGSFMIEPPNPSLALVVNPSIQGFISADDAETIANKLSPLLRPEDFVIAPGVISWMLHSHTADIRTVAVYEYKAESLGGKYLDSSRFVVNSSLYNAKYAIVDDSWRDWWAGMTPEIGTMLGEVSHWPLVMERSNIQVYCNPVFCP